VSATVRPAVWIEVLVARSDIASVALPEVNLTPFVGGPIPGLLYENVQANLMNGDGSNAIPLGSAGTVTQIGGTQSFAQSSLGQPKSFVMKTHKRRAIRATNLRWCIFRHCG
jgi:hypothetical protein